MAGRGSAKITFDDKDAEYDIQEIRELLQPKRYPLPSSNSFKLEELYPEVIEDILKDLEKH